MDISGLLETFSSSLRFYIDEFDRIFLHVSENLPIVGNQIEQYVTESKKLKEEKPREFEPFNSLIQDMEGVRIPIFEIIIELQREDIINQQLNHLAEAVEDVQKILQEDRALFENFYENKNKENLKENFRHLFTLISFLLRNLEMQMEHINRDMTDLIDKMEQLFSDLHRKIRSLYKDRKSIDKAHPEISSAIKSLLFTTDNLSQELEQYNNFFQRLRILQDDLNRELKICINLKKEVDEYQDELGGHLSLKDCRFSNSIIQKIVEKLSVEEEREALRNEYTELHIEESFTRDVVLF